VAVVLLVAIFLLGTVAVRLVAPFRALRRSPLDCGHCGYNLTGNTSGVCPQTEKGVGPSDPLAPALSVP
jgi:hypothetical protein